MARRRAGRYPCRELYLRRREVKGVLECREADDAGKKDWSCPAACPFRSDFWPEGRKAILSDKRSVMLRLGDAPAGKADAVPDFQQGLPRSSIRQGRCRSRAAGLSPRGERSRMSGRPQAAKKPSMRRALSFPMGGQASGTVLGRAHGHVCNRACMPYCLKKGLMGARFGRKGLSSHAGEAPSVDARFVCGRSQAWAEAAAVSSSLRAALRRQASLRSRSSRATMVKRLMKARANCR